MRGALLAVFSSGPTLVTVGVGIKGRLCTQILAFKESWTC